MAAPLQACIIRLEVGYAVTTLNLAMQVVLGLLPLCYGTVIIAALPNTWQWGLVIGLVMLVGLVVCSSLSTPPQTIWPVFSGLFLLLACFADFFQDAFDQLPFTRQPIELIVMCVIGALYIGWGIRSTWRVYASFA